jgi:hypothetical protein
VRLLYAIFDSFSADAISHLPISQTSTFGYLWTPSTSGRFTTHSAYLAILNNDFTGASLHYPSSFLEGYLEIAAYRSSPTLYLENCLEYSPNYNAVTVYYSSL